jgi:hypothetical protein
LALADQQHASLGLVGCYVSSFSLGAGGRSDSEPC